MRAGATVGVPVSGWDYNPAHRDARRRHRAPDIGMGPKTCCGTLLLVIWFVPAAAAQDETPPSSQPPPKQEPVQQPRVKHLGMDLIESTILAEGITQVIKVIARRDRPIHPDGSSNPGCSFPSGLLRDADHRARRGRDDGVTRPVGAASPVFAGPHRQ
jgi:hypothetical protein